MENEGASHEPFLERGQLCPREPENWDSRTWLSALHSMAGSWAVSRSERNTGLSMNWSAGLQPAYDSRQDCAILLKTKVNLGANV
jgi:hypothetical protein